MIRTETVEEAVEEYREHLLFMRDKIRTIVAKRPEDELAKVALEKTLKNLENLQNLLRDDRDFCEMIAGFLSVGRAKRVQISRDLQK